MVKPENLAAAQSKFGETGVQITPEGHKYLGGAIVTAEFDASFTSKKVSEWTSMITKLSEVALSQPQAAFTGFVYSIQHKWTFHQRVIQMQPEAYVPLEKSIMDRLIPPLVGGEVCQDIRSIMSFSARFGGLGIATEVCADEFSESVANTAPHTSAICNQLTPYPNAFNTEARSLDEKSKNGKQRRQQQPHLSLMNNLNKDLQTVNSYCAEKGASSWLTTLSVNDEFKHDKGSFRDALRL